MAKHRHRDLHTGLIRFVRPVRAMDDKPDERGADDAMGHLDRGDLALSHPCFESAQAASIASISELLTAARQRLAQAPFAPPTREAALLLRSVLGISEAQLLARDRQLVEPRAQRRFEELLERRLRGEPVAYLLGEREFYGRPFAVDQRVLIPRPETEHLIAAALDLELPQSPRILDVGAGSGSIAVTLAFELPRAKVFAVDRSLDALQVLRQNILRHEVAGRVEPFCGDLATACELAAFDLVVSNPPYVDPEQRPFLSSEVTDFEPAMALFAADHGTAALSQLLAAATTLRPGAFMVLEIGYDQGAWLTNGVAALDAVELVRRVHDYSGHQRTAVLRRTAEKR